MKIGTFLKAKEIHDELSTLKLALSAMNGFDDCGMATAFDIGEREKNKEVNRNERKGCDS